MVSFTQQNMFEIHACCSMYHALFLLNIMVCCHMDIPHFAYPLMDIEVISIRLGVINDTAVNSAYKSFCECLFSFLLSRYE